MFFLDCLVVSIGFGAVGYVAYLLLCYGPAEIDQLDRAEVEIVPKRCGVCGRQVSGNGQRCPHGETRRG